MAAQSVAIFPVVKGSGPHDVWPAADGGVWYTGQSNGTLGHLDPTQVLARGYSIVRNADGHVRVSSAGLAVGEALDVTFSEGGAVVKVRETR